MGSTERLTDVLSVTLVPARHGYEGDGLLTFRLIAAKSQTMTDELGWWAARHLALDYFAGLGGSLGLRSIDTAEYFLPDGGYVTSPGQGAHIVQLRYYEHSDPHRTAAAIIESLLRGVPWQRYHAGLWPARRDHVTGPISIRVKSIGPVSVDSQYDQNKVTIRCGSYMLGGSTGMDHRTDAWAVSRIRRCNIP